MSSRSSLLFWIIIINGKIYTVPHRRGWRQTKVWTVSHSIHICMQLHCVYWCTKRTEQKKTQYLFSWNGHIVAIFIVLCQTRLNFNVYFFEIHIMIVVVRGDATMLFGIATCPRKLIYWTMVFKFFKPNLRCKSLTGCVNTRVGNYVKCYYESIYWARLSIWSTFSPKWIV